MKFENSDSVADREKGEYDSYQSAHVSATMDYRIGLWTLCLGFVIFLIWAGVAPLDEGVPAQGLVVIDTKKKSVQHLTGGIISSVLVTEGEQVKKNQILVRLDEANARAVFESARQRYIGLRATQGRLHAEQLEQTSIDFHPDVFDAVKDPKMQGVIQNQTSLLFSRRSVLLADLKSIEESKLGQQGLVKAYDSMLLNKSRQLAIIEEELKNTQSLVEEGYVPRNRQLELERMLLEAISNIDELNGSRTKAIQTIAELNQKTFGRRYEYKKDIELQLEEIGKNVESEYEKYVAARNDLNRIEIVSPVDGQVVGLEFQTVGGVIGAGQRLMDIVQNHQTLLIEARLPTHLIDRVKSGLHVDIRFSAFSHTPQLVVEGVVQSVSADALIDQRTGYGYYLVRVAISEVGRTQLGDRILQSGMPVEVIFLTGERTLLKYILSPLYSRISASLKEE